MDYSSSPIDNSPNSPKSNNNSSLGEVGGEQPTKDSNDPSANYDILLDINGFGTWMNETEENNHSNSSKSDRSKTVVDNSGVKTESSNFSIILEEEELNELVRFFIFY